jgi:hypothetical protein
MTTRASIIVLVLVALLAAGTARAQEPEQARIAAASPWLPLDDPAYRYIDALLARGTLRELSALDRPYTVDQVRRALSEMEEQRYGDVVRAWARTLARALDRVDVRDPAFESDAPALRIALLPGGTAETSARRELMLADDSSGAHAAVSGRGMFAAGPVVAVVRIALDQRLKDDPEFAGSKTRSVAGRTEDAYVAGQWRYGSLFLGRQARSWGPFALDGLQLGGYAYSWDHVAGSLGNERLRLTSIVARLDPYQAGADSGRYERHVAMHRLQARVGDLEIGLAEAVVYGGVGRGTELSFANPLSLFQLAQYNEAGDGNVSYAADAAWRVEGLGVLAGQLLVDDLQIDRCSPACEEPASLGWTLSLEGFPLVGDHRLFASYTAVSNLTYRSPQPWERFTSFDVGLGRGFSDYDEARAGIDLALLPQAPVRAYVAHRRSGEGDYRLPFPDAADYPTTPGFLAGRVERTWRAGVTGGLWLGALAVSGDVGYNAVRDADHVAGRSRSGFEGRVRGTLHLVTPAFRP